MRKYFGSALLGLGLCIYFIWFIPLWYDGMTRSVESQNCRLNKSAALWEVDGEIVKHYKSMSNGGFIEFEFTTGDVYHMMEWVFDGQLDSIVAGDRILKEKGELFIEVIGDKKKLRFSLDHGCPGWADKE